MNFIHSTLQAVQLPASGPSTYPAMTGCRHFDAPAQSAAHPNMFTNGNPLTYNLNPPAATLPGFEYDHHIVHKQVSCHE